MGLQQENGDIDSIVVGGSFSYADPLFKAMDDKAAEKRAEDTKSKPDLKVAV